MLGNELRREMEPSELAECSGEPRLGRVNGVSLRAKGRIGRVEGVDADLEIARKSFREGRDGRNPLQRDSAPYATDQKDRDPGRRHREPDS